MEKKDRLKALLEGIADQKQKSVIIALLKLEKQKKSMDTRKSELKKFIENLK